MKQTHNQSPALGNPTAMQRAAARVVDQIGEKPIVPLYPSQRRWRADKSRFAGWIKAVQVGASFGEAARVVENRVTKPGLQIYLSAKEDLTKEFVLKCKQICQAAGVVAELHENEFFKVGNTEYLVQRIEWPNGSRLIGLAANPETAVSYTGDVTWDETARTPNDDEIKKALLGRVSRGYTLRLISNPRGERGYFWSIARMLGLADGVAPATQPVQKNGWSGHWTDINLAVAEGCPLNIEELKDGYAGDEDSWAENHLCIFLSTASEFFPLELIQPCISSRASTEFEPLPGMELYLGADVGRRRDLFVKTITEHAEAAYVVRRIRALQKAKFSAQREEIRSDARLCRRGCIDATGLGMQLAEETVEEFPAILEGVDFTAQIKHSLVTIGKEHFENRTIFIPDFDPLIQSIRAIRKTLTPAGNWIFDAERTDKTGHADYAWSLFLSLMAAKTGIAAADVGASPAEQPRLLRDGVPSDDRRPHRRDQDRRGRDEEQEVVGVGGFRELRDAARRLFG